MNAANVILSGAFGNARVGRVECAEIQRKATASQLLQALGPRGDSGSRQDGQTVLSVASPFDEITGGVTLADVDRDDYRRYVEAGRSVAKTAGLGPGASGLIINGRVRFHPLVCPFPPPDIMCLYRACRSLGRSHQESSPQRTTEFFRTTSWRSAPSLC